MNHSQVDLAAIARQEMMARGFEPDIPGAAQVQAEGARQKADAALVDLTSLLWSSIDNDESRDLDQVEWAERICACLKSRSAAMSWIRRESQASYFAVALTMSIGETPGVSAPI